MRVTIGDLIVDQIMPGEEDAAFNLINRLLSDKPVAYREQAKKKAAETTKRRIDHVTRNQTQVDPSSDLEWLKQDNFPNTKPLTEPQNEIWNHILTIASPDKTFNRPTLFASMGISLDDKPGCSRVASHLKGLRRKGYIMQEARGKYKVMK